MRKEFLSGKQNIISLSKGVGIAEEDQSKLLRVNQIFNIIFLPFTFCKKF